MTWHDDHHDDEELTPEALDAALAAWPDDAVGRRIADAARDYNAPAGAVPRDAMWAAIVGARIPAAPDAAPAVVPALRVERTTVHEIRRIDRRRTWWGLAAAAAIFLATGVGIGRWWGGANVASAPTTAPQVASAPTSPATSAPAIAPGVTTSSSSAPEPAAAPQPVNVSRPAATVASAPRASVVRGPDPYDVAITRHFTQAEALLVSYRADTVDAAMDAQLAKWARPLLSNTQLLLDSPAADDPRRRRILEDLELVLAQVTRLAPPSTDTTRADRVERQIIDGTLQRAQLLPRIRNLVAAGS